MAFKSQLKCLFLKPIFCILFATFLHFACNTTLDEYSKKIENMTIDQKLNLIEQLIEEIMLLENREIYIKKIQSKLKW